MICEMLIEHGNTLYKPCVVDDVSVEWERQGQPGKMTFSVLKDDLLRISNGDACRFSVDGETIFFGFIFTLAESGQDDNIVKVTVYDQLRYFKNKDTYVYTEKTASQLLRMIAEDYMLNIGEIENSNYVIASAVEDNESLFDIVQNALDETIKARAEMYVLFDNKGEICLKNIKNMVQYLVVSKDTAADYDYKTSIDDKTYNRIKLVCENDKKGVNEVFIAQDSANINKWGVLQHYEKIKDSENAKVKADAMLKLYNSETKTLRIKEAFGNTKIRAGTLLTVLLNMQDSTTVGNLMLVEQVKHTFKDNEHFMDLKVRGGEFVA